MELSCCQDERALPLRGTLFWKRQKSEGLCLRGLMSLMLHVLPKGDVVDEEDRRSEAQAARVSELVMQFYVAWRVWMVGEVSIRTRQKVAEVADCGGTVGEEKTLRTSWTCERSHVVVVAAWRMRDGYGDRQRCDVQDSRNARVAEHSELHDGARSPSRMEAVAGHRDVHRSHNRSRSLSIRVDACVPRNDHAGGLPCQARSVLG